MQTMKVNYHSTDILPRNCFCKPCFVLLFKRLRTQERDGRVAFLGN